MKISSPVTRMDLARAAGKRNPLFFSYGYDQIEEGDSWTVRMDGREIVAVGGIVDAGEGLPKIWLIMPELARNHMLTVVRAIRLTLAQSSYSEIECLATTREGSRIAALCGLSFVEATKNNMEIWRWLKR